MPLRQGVWPFTPLYQSVIGYGAPCWGAGTRRGMRGVSHQLRAILWRRVVPMSYFMLEQWRKAKQGHCLGWRLATAWFLRKALKLNFHHRTGITFCGYPGPETYPWTSKAKAPYKPSAHIHWWGLSNVVTTGFKGRWQMRFLSEQSCPSHISTAMEGKNG